MARKKKLTKAQIVLRKTLILENLERNLGILTPTLKTVDITPSVYYTWYYDDPEFRQAVDSIKNVAVDYVESKLMENIKAGDKVSIIFYLKCQAKHRGYVEKIEQDINMNAAPIPVTVNIVYPEKK